MKVNVGGERSTLPKFAVRVSHTNVPPGPRHSQRAPIAGKLQGVVKLEGTPLMLVNLREESCTHIPHPSLFLVAAV